MDTQSRGHSKLHHLILSDVFPAKALEREPGRCRVDRVRVRYEEYLAMLHTVDHRSSMGSGSRAACCHNFRRHWCEAHGRCLMGLSTLSPVLLYARMTTRYRLIGSFCGECPAWSVARQETEGRRHDWRCHHDGEALPAGNVRFYSHAIDTVVCFS